MRYCILVAAAVLAACLVLRWWPSAMYDEAAILLSVHFDRTLPDAPRIDAELDSEVQDMLRITSPLKLENMGVYSLNYTLAPEINATEEGYKLSGNVTMSFTPASKVKEVMNLLENAGYHSEIPQQCGQGAVQ